VESPADDWFVNVNITIPDFQVEPAIRVGANPGFVVNGCPLAAKIRQGHQVSRITLLTFREIGLFHEVLLPTKIRFESYAVYTIKAVVARAYFSSTELIWL
jgi:hypothetical protein